MVWVLGLIQWQLATPRVVTVSTVAYMPSENVFSALWHRGEDLTSFDGGAMTVACSGFQKFKPEEEIGLQQVTQPKLECVWHYLGSEQLPWLRVR